MGTHTTGTSFTAGRTQTIQDPTRYQQLRQRSTSTETNDHEVKGNHSTLNDRDSLTSPPARPGSSNSVVSAMCIQEMSPLSLKTGSTETYKGFSELYIILLFAFLLLMGRNNWLLWCFWANTSSLEKWANVAKWRSVNNAPWTTGNITLKHPMCRRLPSRSLISPEDLKGLSLQIALLCFWDSMKDGCHCHGQIWQRQFDVLPSRAF